MIKLCEKGLYTGKYSSYQFLNKARFAYAEKSAEGISERVYSNFLRLTRLSADWKMSDTWFAKLWPDCLVSFYENVHKNKRQCFVTFYLLKNHLQWLTNQHIVIFREGQAIYVRTLDVSVFVCSLYYLLSIKRRNRWASMVDVQRIISQAVVI